MLEVMRLGLRGGFGAEEGRKGVDEGGEESEGG